jgi:hypothetical protein
MSYSSSIEPPHHYLSRPLNIDANTSKAADHDDLRLFVRH